MNPMAIGFSGKIGSGKTSIAKAISKALNIKYVSFGQYVKEVAATRGLNPLDRMDLQVVGNELINNGVQAFSMDVLSSVNWQRGESLVIDGIRHKAVLSFLKEYTYKKDFTYIFIDVNERVREIRLIERNENVSDINENDQGETEYDVHHILRPLADIVVSNDNELSSVVEDLLCVLCYRR